MDGAIREPKGEWKLASLQEVVSAGYASQVDLDYPEFYESLFVEYLGFLPQSSNPADA